MEMKKCLEDNKKYAYGISLKYLQKNETFITNICSNPSAIDIILKYELYNKTIEGLCKNPHPKAFNIIKKNYNKNRYFDLLSYNRNPFVIKLLSDNFTQFNTNGYNNPGIAQREIDNIMVDFDGSNPELLLIINKINMKNFIGNTQTLYFPKNIGINPKGYEIIRKLDNERILYMCDYDKSVNEKLLFYMNYHLYDIIKDKYINMLPSCYYYIIKYKSDLVKYNMIKCLIAFNNSEWIHLLNIDMPKWLEIINEFEGLLPYALCKNVRCHCGRPLPSRSRAPRGP
jgi:hypothetical protein